MRGNIFMVGLLLAATGCGRLGFAPLTDGSVMFADASRSARDAGEIDVAFGGGPDIGPHDTSDFDMGRQVFNPAQEVQLANGDPTSDPSISEGVEIVYSHRAGPTEPRDLYFARRSPSGNGFFGGLPVPNLNSMADDASASLSRDGLTIWFSSTRPGGEGAHDVYVATRNNTFFPWSGLARVPELSTALADDAPSVAGTMLHAVVSQASARGDRDLFTVDRNFTDSPWNPPVPINELNTTQQERAPALSADGLTLYFASDRPPSAGLGDLWVAERPDLFSPFGPPERLEELATAEDESSPWINFDGSRLYFDRGTGPGDRRIFQATR